MAQRKSHKKQKKIPFDPHAHYAAAVQGPDDEMRLLARWFRTQTGRRPLVLREDFCGTFANSIAWAKVDPQRHAYGIDLDPNPIQYGREQYLPKVKASVQERVHITLGDVLHPHKIPPADMICALNFSFNVLQRREDLVEYFRGVRRGLTEGGMWVGDVYGGSDTVTPHETSRRVGSFTYYWELSSYNPIHNRATFFIHFKRRNEAKRLRVFRYDWRLWSISEIREALALAGLADSRVYWEGTMPDGSGNDVYRQAETGEPCKSWVAYITARKLG